jgi:hypothetical protein
MDALKKERLLSKEIMEGRRDDLPRHRITQVWYKKLVSDEVERSNVEIGAFCEVEVGEDPEEVYDWLKMWVLYKLEMERRRQLSTEIMEGREVDP